MRRFLLGRLVRLLIVVFGVSVLTFLFVYLSGDPVLLMLPEGASPQEIEQFRKAMGFDQPLYVQYVRFFMGVLRGDFGISLQHHRPAMQVVIERLPATVQIALTAIVITMIVTIPLGVISAFRRGKALDTIVLLLVVLGQSVPIYWTAILFMLFFGVKWQMLPISGWGTWQHMILPTLTLGLFTAPAQVHMMRSAMLEVLQSDYIRTARAKGLSERSILYTHALKNAALPFITMLGIQAGRLLSGSVVTESIFAVPGVGRVTVQAIQSADFPLVQAAVLFLSLVIVGFNFVVDLCYSWVNPQIRFE